MLLRICDESGSPKQGPHLRYLDKICAVLGLAKGGGRFKKCWGVFKICEELCDESGSPKEGLCVPRFR